MFAALAADIITYIHSENRGVSANCAGGEGPGDGVVVVLARTTVRRHSRPVTISRGTIAREFRHLVVIIIYYNSTLYLFIF